MPEIGDVVGHYRIERQLGAGGMGVVYLAEDTELGRPVALKFLAPEMVRHPEGLRRFKNEALAAAELAHPNLATIYDVKLGPDEYYLAMEFLQGQDLAALIKRGPLSVETILHVMKEVARGLVHAHERGVIHRDIKSANIFVGENDRIKILDFGLAHRVDATRITRQGTTLGTIGYMSPEQVRGRPADVRSDIWSLGIVLYECATGQLPFEAESYLAVGNRICNEEPEGPSSLRMDLPLALEKIFRRCVQKDTSLRYQHADEVLAEIFRVERELYPEQAPRSPLAFRVPRWLRELWRRRVFLNAAGYLAAAVLLVWLATTVTQRVMWSPYVVDVARTSLFVLAPSVLYLSWRRGGPWAGRRPWTPVDLSVLPVNLFLLTAFLLVGFRERDLGSLNMEVDVPTQAGVVSKRLIPKPHFRRHLSTNYFDNTSGDASLDWLSYAMHDLVSTDLSQDMFVELRSPLLQRDKMRDDGHTDGVQLSTAYQRELARLQNSEYFLAGSIGREGEDYVVETRIYQTRDARLMAIRSHRGVDPLALADEISLQIREDLKIPPQHLRGNPDLAVAQMESASLPAIEHATKGMTALYLDHDPQRATAQLDQAVELDPSYASAQLLRFVAWNDPAHPRRNPQKAGQALQATLANLYRFSERQRLSVQSTAFLIQQELGSCLTVNQARVKLYPEDAQAHVTLARVLRLRGADEDALAQFQEAYRLDPQRSELLLDIGELQQRLGDPRSALASYETLEQVDPANAEAAERLGRALLSLGRFDEAATAIDRATVLDPANLDRKLARGLVDERRGDFERAEMLYRRALAQSTSPADSVAAHASLKELTRSLGRVSEARQHALLERDGWQRLGEPGRALEAGYEIAALDAAAGRAEVARQWIARLSADCAPEFVVLCSVAAAEAYLELGETVSADAELHRLDDAPSGSLLAGFAPRIALCKARLDMASGAWANAARRLATLHNDGATTALFPAIQEALARCHRELGNSATAIAELERLLELQPGRARAHLELALSLEQLGRSEDARRHAMDAITMWKGADLGFGPRAEAEKLLQRLSGS
jgi:tetratricopeptide (TPR) repeat protein